MSFRISNAKSISLQRNYFFNHPYLFSLANRSSGQTHGSAPTGINIDIIYCRGEPVCSPCKIKFIIPET